MFINLRVHFQLRDYIDFGGFFMCSLVLVAPFPIIFWLNTSHCAIPVRALVSAEPLLLERVKRLWRLYVGHTLCAEF
ncbi:hypothetical protein DN388_08345 [Pseudomonas sp. S12(2018)]|nr:hypothetical protein [Pseudomonas sp. S12(2018)]